MERWGRRSVRWWCMKLYGLITGLERKMVIIHNHHVSKSKHVQRKSISQCTKMRTEIRLFGAMALKCLGRGEELDRLERVDMTSATPYVPQSCDMECAPVSVAEQG